MSPLNTIAQGKQVLTALHNDGAKRNVAEPPPLGFKSYLPPQNCLSGLTATKVDYYGSRSDDRLTTPAQNRALVDKNIRLERFEMLQRETGGWQNVERRQVAAA